jgi:sugar lactone lactonase YvrE
MITVAGNGKAGFSGDGGPATQARLNSPFEAAVDGAGNLFIDDDYHSCVRRVSPDGTITTVAGIGGHGGFSGDGGPATKARLQDARGLTIDTVGDLFFSDEENHRVRKVDSAGIITTVAGGGGPADGLGDGGPATAAKLVAPIALAVDPRGNLFIADSQAQRVRKVDSAGIITTVAGTGQVGHSGDGGPTTAVPLNSPSGVCLDRAGNLFSSECDRFSVHVDAIRTYRRPPETQRGMGATRRTRYR